MAKEKSIISEIAERAEDYEGAMSSSLSDTQAFADLWKVKPPRRKDRTFSNPRQTEFYRASEAVAVLAYRMMTAADPFYSATPVDFNADYDAIETAMATWETQLRYAKYKQNLLQACRFAPVFGTVICQEDYRLIGVSPFGRRVPVTVLMPRVLDQVMFDRATINIDEAEWLSTADVTGKADLRRMLMESKEIQAPWNKKALEAAINADEDKNTINPQVLERIRRSGFTNDDAFSRKKELLMFYGKLDCMNDGVEYVAALINRKYLVRFHANANQNGRRPFRVARWTTFDTSLGYGIGHILGHQHTQLDANRQKTQDLGSFGAYNMYKRRRNTVSDEDLIVRPLQIIDVDGMDDLQPVQTNLSAMEGLLRLDELLKQEFRAASGASDTLQAIATNVTATASSLAQNEALRAASVRAEQLAEPLVREHIENLHWNNVQNMNAPININKAGIVRTVYPRDLRLDLEIKAKIVTDKDFQPQRLEKLIQLVQILTSTKSTHQDLASISIAPIVKEVARLLDVNPNAIFTQNVGMPQMAPGLGAPDMMQLAMSSAPGMGGGMGAVNTPAGMTLTA